MKTFLIIFFIFLTSVIKAHYPTDLLTILSKSELIVTGNVIESNNDYFKISIDTVIYGEIIKDIIIIKYKKNSLELQNAPKYKDYKINQKLLLFLKHENSSNDTIWISTGSYVEAELEINNDTIHFSPYHNIRTCSYLDFISSIEIFNYYFDYSFNESEYVVTVKQTRNTNGQLIHCYFDFYRELINILQGGNSQTVFKKNQEWQYDLENRFFHPVNGMYNNCNSILKGKFKKGKRTGLWYIHTNEYVYEKGEVVEERIYYENGKVRTTLKIKEK